MNKQDYGAMPKVEQTLASDLSLDTTSSLKSQSLPTKPCRTNLALVGNVVDQAKGCVQAYQADLLKDLDEKEGVYVWTQSKNWTRPLICFFGPIRRRPEPSAILWKPWWPWIGNCELV